ncbi:Alkylated DNA repair dioxygenase AlkB [Ekhidna lutea]|uniref:Alkylated DNA repair dioxygenase AlkB n=1 Tax=Ekhidna lutea TaxID=447679 RepID=A0A239LBK5_EKHLU|nr:alpha-ketoglutarate-dependent dioxygenase AlkB [Ekhidna lutea]SNT27851.1 Alkylated DNA repair dioxygenase AlkB [Ekhidna lutea]
MELFEREAYPSKNWLPHDGTVNYYGKIFELLEADRLFEIFLATIDWQPDQAVIFGKTIVTKRKVAWYAEKSFPYRYSGTTKVALPWTEELRSIKELAEKHSGETYNSCLLNLYHSGEEGMAWHSDGETELKKDGSIASLSFGAERKFSFKHKQTKERIDLLLENGSLLVMKGTTQTHWLHRLPPTKKVNQPRINLTFRQMEEN